MFVAAARESVLLSGGVRSPVKKCIFLNFSLALFRDYFCMIETDHENVYDRIFCSWFLLRRFRKKSQLFSQLFSFFFNNYSADLKKVPKENAPTSLCACIIP